MIPQMTAAANEVAPEESKKVEEPNSNNNPESKVKVEVKEEVIDKKS